MSSLTRGSVALVLSSAFVLAIACGSSSKKQAPPYTPPGDGGEAGATQPSAGATSGGAAGMSEPGAAGEGGAPIVSEGGAAGVAGAAVGEAGASAEGGSGGAPELACVPSGSVASLSFNTEPTYQVCRGGIARVPFDALSSDPQFTCCAVSNAAYDFSMLGISNGDGGGELYFQIPADAPLTEQALTLACDAGPIAGSMGIGVTDTAPPVLSSISAQITEQGQLDITGSNLGTVDEVWALPLQVDQGNESNPRSCGITATSQTATHIDCDFGYIAPGQYVVYAFAAGCGAVATTTLTVIPPA